MGFLGQNDNFSRLFWLSVEGEKGVFKPSKGIFKGLKGISTEWGVNEMFYEWNGEGKMRENETFQRSFPLVNNRFFRILRGKQQWRLIKRYDIFTRLQELKFWQ